MRLVCLAVLLLAGTARADAWSDAPARIAAIDLKPCKTTAIDLIITHDSVTMPFPNVGGRGFTDEERCLFGVLAKASVPPLPAEIEHLEVFHELGTEPVLGNFPALDRDALHACTKQPVHLIIDVRHGATRVWLPAWQFHSDTGDGTTPDNQKPIKACLTRAVARWKLPTLSKDLVELAVRIGPA